MPEGANGSVGRYVKGQCILVNSFKKETEAGKVRNKLVQKGKAVQKLMKKLSKTEGRRFGVLLRDKQTQPLGGIGRI